MRPVRAVIAAALASAVAASCWQPAFEPELSASSLTSSKMELVSTITVTGMKEYRSAPGIFLPRRVAAPTDGIWLHGSGLAPYEFESTSPWYMKTALSYELFSIWSQGFSAAPRGWPIARMSPAINASTPFEALVVATKFPTWGAAWLYETYAPARSIALNNDSPILLGSNALLAAGFATADTGSDLLLMVYFDKVAELWMAGELSLPVSPPPPAFTTQPIAMPAGYPAPSSLGIGFAARKGTDYYLSVTDDSGVTTAYRWADGLLSPPEKLAGVQEPLVAVLTDGALLASDGMTMTAHNDAGEPQYSFPVGSLRFVHERYDATATTPRWMAVFCRTLFIRDQNDDEGTLRTEVFEIPVNELSSLEP